MNSEGWTLIGIDPACSENDIKFSAMRVNQIGTVIDTFFACSSNESRIFLHARAATTRSVGIAYNHGFDNGIGTMIMHNGIIENSRRLSVDSFNLIDFSDEPEEMLEQLQANGETFANIFLINQELGGYGIVRLKTGTLYTDGKGNYSTNKLCDIDQPVLEYSWEQHEFSQRYSQKEYMTWNSLDEDYFNSWDQVKTK
jgi:hypothetical protein